MATTMKVQVRNGSKDDGTPTYKTRWRVRYRTDRGQSRSLTFDRKIDADNFRKDVEHQHVAGTFIDRAAGRITFGEYAESWLEHKRVTTRSSTSETFASHLRRHLLPAFGDCELRSIDRQQVKAFADRLQPKVAPTTARAIVFTLAAVLREAVDDERIVANPAERIKVGAKTRRRVDPMHVAGVAVKVTDLADAMPARWRAAVLLMASTGLRLGECLGLTVDRIDFLRPTGRTIRIDRQLRISSGVTAGWSEPKTAAGVRTIPVPTHVTDMLAAHLAEFPAGDGGLVFTTTTGGPIARTSWANAYRAACAQCGVVGRTRTHDLRHVAASSLIASGLSVSAVQAVLGHASPSETLDVYTHFWPGDEDRTRAAIEQASAAWFRVG